jgi:YggT family protein
LEDNGLRAILLEAVEGFATLYMLIIMIRVLMTWLREDVLVRFYKVFNLIAKITDPFLDLIKKCFPTGIGRLDFSPLIAVVLIEVVKYFLIYLIRSFIKA